MQTGRRRLSVTGATLLGAAVVGLIALFFVYMPLFNGGEPGLVGVLMILDMIAGIVGLWLLIWTGLFWVGKADSQRRVDPE